MSRPVRNPESGPWWPLRLENVVWAKSIIRRSTAGSVPLHWLVPRRTLLSSVGGAEVRRSKVDIDDEEASSEPDEHSDTGDSHSFASGLQLLGDL